MACILNASTSGPCPTWTFTNANQISGDSYDAAGDLTNDGSRTYQYDAEQRPISVGNGSAASYTYNALGQRVQCLWPGAPYNFLYAPNGAPVYFVLAPVMVQDNIVGLVGLRVTAVQALKKWGITEKEFQEMDLN